MIRTAVNKTELARELGISRSSLYYRPKRPAVIEELYRMIYYYNQKRIHSKLKMPPVQYRQKHQKDLKEGIESMP